MESRRNIEKAPEQEAEQKDAQNTPKKRRISSSVTENITLQGLLLHTPEKQKSAGSPLRRENSEFKSPFLKPSPFKGIHANHYTNSVKAIANSLQFFPNLEARQQVLGEAILMVDENNLALNLIRDFISDFWSDEINIAATRSAYTERNQAQEQSVDGSKNLLEIVCTYLDEVIKMLKVQLHLLSKELSSPSRAIVQQEIQKIQANLGAWKKEDGKNIPALGKQELSIIEDIFVDIESLSTEVDEQENERYQIECLQNAIAYVISSIEEGSVALKKQIISANKKKLTIANKVDNVTDPLCLSFAIVASTKSKNNFYLVSISSPDKNKVLYDLLFKFIENSSKYDELFQLAEASSKNFQKMMLSVGGMIGQPLPRHTYRECAEKSCIATLSKLSHFLQTELTVSSMINTAFYPVEKSKAKIAENLLAIKVGEKEYVVKLIPPCDDCKKRMETDKLILQSANKQLFTASPLKNR